jgi:hypothetical protein
MSSKQTHQKTIIIDETHKKEPLPIFDPLLTLLAVPLIGVQFAANFSFAVLNGITGPDRNKWVFINDDKLADEKELAVYV